MDMTQEQIQIKGTAVKLWGLWTPKIHSEQAEDPGKW